MSLENVRRPMAFDEQRVAMNPEIAEKLSEINKRFYQQHCDSFATTRQAPWPGWRRCLELLEPELGLGPGLELEPGCARPAVAVLDLACGNLRFESFLQAALPEVAFNFHAVDNCDALIAGASPTPPAATHYQHLDIQKLLQASGQLNRQLAAPACDLSVSFGFLHHLPLPQQRRELLRSLVAQTRSGGHVIVSLWQFLNNQSLRGKAQSILPLALEQLGLEDTQLADNDFLLGWQDIPGAYRYCHSFTEAEIDQLAASVADSTKLIARFASDGRSNNLNSYLVFRVK